jgi:amino acid transporter
VFGAALAAVGFAIYLDALITPISLNIPLTAALIVIVLTVLEIRGLKEIGIIIPVSLITTFIIFIASGLLHGLMPKPLLPAKPNNVSGVFLATVFTVPMFLGVRAIAASGARIKEPSKNIPRALILSALIMIMINCSVAYIAVGVVPHETLADLAESHTPLLTLAARTIQLPPLPLGAWEALVNIVGVFAALASLTTAMMVQSSIAVGLSRDGYFPKAFLSFHKRFKTPFLTIIINSLFIELFTITGVIVFLGYAASFASILVFIFVNFSLMKLRKKMPHLKRPFKAPLYPLVPLAGIVVAPLLLVFPIILGEESAVSALTLSISLLILAFMAYHLRMIGRYRLQVALGGASLGIGIFGILLTCLIGTGLVPLALPHIQLCLLIFASVVSIIAGVLNISTCTRKIF